ncbi:MAG TPA: hypothetical protein VJS85_05655, partial [Rhizomicrobium sp.]|nr:hypothetical protein [Rhizomicrobium sp.]
MVFDIALTARGHLVLTGAAQADDGGIGNISETVAATLREAFKRGQSELLLCLATLPDRSWLPPAFDFWRGLSERYLT